MSYVEDKRGVPRGSCICGQCAHYVPQPEGHACGYCGCLPVKHEDLRKISNQQKSSSMHEPKTELDSEDELPAILGPSRPRKSKTLPDRSDDIGCIEASEQKTARLSSAKTCSDLGSVKTNNIHCGVGLAQESHVRGSVNISQHENSDAPDKIPPCELLQTSHMPYYELPNKQPMRGVFKIAYKHKTIYIGKSLNIRRHLKRLVPGRLRQEIGKFLRNLPKKKKKYLTVSWIDSDVYKHNCKGNSYFKCITRIQGEKPKYSYPKIYTETGGAAAVPAAVVSTPDVTGMITTAVQDSQEEMGDDVSRKRSDVPPQRCYTGEDPRQVKKKRSDSPQHPHRTLTGSGQGRSKKSFVSGNLLKKNIGDVSEGNKVTVFESDVHEVESEVGNLASFKAKCQTNPKKPKTSAGNLLSKALQSKSTRRSTKGLATTGMKEHSTKTKSCSVLLNKNTCYIPEANVMTPPRHHFEKKPPDTEAWHKKIQQVPIEKTTVTKSSTLTVVKVKSKDVTTTTRYMDAARSATTTQAKAGVYGQENQLTDIRLNTSTPFPIIPTLEKNESETICKEEKSDKEYSSPGITFTVEDNQDWVPDILDDSGDSMKLIIDERQCTYSPETSQDTNENMKEIHMSPLKMEHDNQNGAFRSDSKSRPEEADASVPASPGNKEGSPESTPKPTKWLSVSPVQYQQPTKTSPTDSLRPQTVPVMSQFPNSFVENEGTLTTKQYPSSSHSINRYSVSKSRPEGSTEGTIVSGSTNERVSPGTLPSRPDALVFANTNSPTAADDTEPIKAFFESATSDATTKSPQRRISRCDTRIVVCDRRTESCSPQVQYRKRSFIRKESWPMYDNIEHWRSHQHHFKSFSYSRSYTRREHSPARIETRHENWDVEDQALVKIERP